MKNTLKKATEIADYQAYLKRKHLFFVVFCMAAANMFAQDIITLKNGNEIKAIVQEIGYVEIIYKEFNNPKGSNYTLKKSEVLRIEYVNGDKDVFNIINENSDEQKTENVEERKPVTQQRDSYSNMKSYDEIINKMTDEQVLDYFKTNVDDYIYNTFHKGYRLRDAGKDLLRMGIAIPTVGILAVLIARLQNERVAMITGVSLVGFGSTLALVSIPVNAVGGALKKKAENMYREKYFGNRYSYQSTLNFNFTGNGFAFRLNF